MANDLLLRDLNDIIEGDDFSKSNKNDKILIAIVSDSRKELIRSMRSAVENADNAYRIGFAVYAVNFKKDDIKDNVKGMDLYVKDADNIDFVDAHKFFAHVSEKYDYICYTDKHSRFNKLWDSAIVSMINHSEDKSNTVISLDLPDRRKREMVTVSANDYKNIFSSDTDVLSDRSMILFEAVHYYQGI